MTDGSSTLSETFTINVTMQQDSAIWWPLANPTVAELGSLHSNYNAGTVVASVSGLANELGARLSIALPQVTRRTCLPLIPVPEL